MGAKRREQDLIEKIRRLPRGKLAEVEDFVDFLRERQEDRRLAQAATGASAAAFANVWATQTMPNMTAFDRGDTHVPDPRTSS